MKIKETKVQKSCLSTYQERSPKTIFCWGPGNPRLLEPCSDTSNRRPCHLLTADSENADLMFYRSVLISHVNLAARADFSPDQLSLEGLQHNRFISKGKYTVLSFSKTELKLSVSVLGTLFFPSCFELTQ